MRADALSAAASTVDARRWRGYGLEQCADVSFSLIASVRPRWEKTDMNLTLEGHAALVTGANGGLGSHFAQTLARAGAKVAIAARRLDSLREVEEQIRSAGG